MKVEKFYDYHPSKEINFFLEKIDTLKNKITALKKKADSNLIAIIQQKLKFHWTYHSNAIEGSTLSLGDTIFFLQEGLTVSGKPLKDFIDASNHANAIDYLQEIISNQRPLTASLMKEINALLLAGVTSTPAINNQGQIIAKPATPGEYKKQPNHVIQANGNIHHYVEPIHVASEMDELFNWLNQNLEKLPPIILAAVAHYNMVRIHPFDDGNGRGARILMNLILLKKNYPPTIITIENRKLYLDALNQADHKNIEPFLQLVAQSLLETEKMIVNEL